jgi:AraC-like DNA-binding protein
MLDITIISYIGITQAVFSILFSLSKMKKQVQDWLFIFCICVLTMPLCYVLIGGSEFQHIVSMYYYAISIFFFGPLLYIYSRLMVSKRPVFKKNDALHILAAMCAVLAALTCFKIVSFLTMLSLVSYSIAISWMLHRHRKNSKHYASCAGYTRLCMWLKGVAMIYGLLFVCAFSVIGKGKPRVIFQLSFSSFIILFSFIYLKLEALYVGAHLIKHSHERNEPLIRYQRSGLKSEDMGDYLQKIETYMQSEKPYYDNQLNVHNIASKLNIPRHYITQVINEKLHKNFYMYVNEYRIREFKSLLESKNYQEYSLLRLAYHVGFNSKSSFNNIFKKYTGMTPSRYRDSIKKCFDS